MTDTPDKPERPARSAPVLPPPSTVPLAPVLAPPAPPAPEVRPAAADTARAKHHAHVVERADLAHAAECAVLRRMAVAADKGDGALLGALAHALAALRPTP